MFVMVVVMRSQASGMLKLHIRQGVPPVLAGFTKLHKPVHFAETLSLTKRWMADSSPDYRGTEYTLVRLLLFRPWDPLDVLSK